MEKELQWRHYTMLMHDVLKTFGGLEGMGATKIGRGRHTIEIHLEVGESLVVNDGDYIVRQADGEITVRREA